MTTLDDMKGTRAEWRDAFLRADELLRRAHHLARKHHDPLSGDIEGLYDATLKLMGRDKAEQPQEGDECPMF